MSDPVSKLVDPRGNPPVRTNRRETDTRTAMTRGLAEYMRTIVTEEFGGRRLSFNDVKSVWAVPEDPATYPSAIVYTQQPGVYDASRFSPAASRRDKLAEPPNTYLMQYAELIQDLVVELWCNDPEERMGLVAATEGAFNPFDFMYGFHLELPHYYNVRATFEMKSLQYLDTEEDAVRRYRKAAFIVTGQMPVVRLMTFPEAIPKARLDAVGPDVVVEASVEAS